MRKIINIILIIASLVLIFGLLLAIAADNDKPSEQETNESMGISLSREEIPKLVEIIRIWKLVDELKLKEEQLLEFLPRFKELSDLTVNYYRNRREILHKLRTDLEGNPSEDEIRPIVNEFRDAEVKFRQRERELEDALNSSLTVRQQAKYALFRDSYRRDMNRLVRNLQELSKLRDRRMSHQPTLLKEKKEG